MKWIVDLNLNVSIVNYFQFGLNKLTDLLRRDVAACGFTEILTFTLVRHFVLFGTVNRRQHGLEEKSGQFQDFLLLG